MVAEQCRRKGSSGLPGALVHCGSRGGCQGGGRDPRPPLCPRSQAPLAQSAVACGSSFGPLRLCECLLIPQAFTEHLLSASKRRFFSLEFPPPPPPWVPLCSCLLLRLLVELLSRIRSPPSCAGSQLASFLPRALELPALLPGLSPLCT